MVFLERNNIDPLVSRYQLITGEKVKTVGVIIKAKYFEDFIESNESTKITKVSGYEYDYIFTSKKGKKVKGSSYGVLPNNKVISQIPYNVSVEYLVKNPKINRIAGLISDNLFEFFKQELFIPLLIFIFCCYAALKVIERGIKKYKNDLKYYLDSLSKNKI